MKFLRRGALLALDSFAFSGLAHARQTVALRLHQVLPPQAAIPAKAITPWAKEVEADSNGRIKVQMLHAMQMGGSPSQLFDQARDGVADITGTVPGYTPVVMPAPAITSWRWTRPTPSAGAARRPWSSRTGWPT